MKESINITTNWKAHPNPLLEPLLQPVNTRRLKRCWPLDLQSTWGDIAGWIPYHVIAIHGIIITLAYRLYYFWLLISSNNNNNNNNSKPLRPGHVVQLKPQHCSSRHVVLTHRPYRKAPVTLVRPISASTIRDVTFPTAVALPKHVGPAKSLSTNFIRLRLLNC
jgi:hypothetical protein